MIEYAIYKGEKFIAEGTADELAKLLNVKPTTIKWWSSPSLIQGEIKVIGR